MTDDMNAQTSSVATKRPSDGATGKKRKRSFTHALYTGEISYGFIQRRKVWYTIDVGLCLPQCCHRPDMWHSQVSTGSQ